MIGNKSKETRKENEKCKQYGGPKGRTGMSVSCAPAHLCS